MVTETEFLHKNRGFGLQGRKGGPRQTHVEIDNERY